MIASETEARAWLDEIAGVLAVERLEQLIALLTEENQRQNLVSAGSLAQAWRRHVVDSAQLLRFVPRGTDPWLDLGTGAGFPGLVIGLLRPDTEVTVVEARPLRAGWLERAKAELGLGNVTVCAGRAERLAARPYGVISARAFAPLARLVGLAERFSTKQTLWVLPKGRSAAQELQGLRGWHHTFHVEQSLTDADASVIVGRLLGKKGPG